MLLSLMQSNAKCHSNNTASLGRELTVFHFGLPDGKAQVKMGSKNSNITQEGINRRELIVFQIPPFYSLSLKE